MSNIEPRPVTEADMLAFLNGKKFAQVESGQVVDINEKQRKDDYDPAQIMAETRRAAEKILVREIYAKGFGEMPSFKEILTVVSAVSKVRVSDIMSRNRAKPISKARQVVCILLHQCSTNSVLSLAQRMKLHHSTINHAVNVGGDIRKEIEEFLNPALEVLRKKYDALDERMTKIISFREQTLMRKKCHRCHLE